MSKRKITKPEDHIFKNLQSYRSPNLQVVCACACSTNSCNTRRIHHWGESRELGRCENAQLELEDLIAWIVVNGMISGSGLPATEQHC